MNDLSLIQKICVYALPVLFGITLHEVAHGWAARRFGDRTAEMLGRLSLNPLKHIDPVGTVLVPLLLLVTSKMLTGTPLIFGWAKPVPVDYRNLRNPKRDMIWIAAAGPAANLAMAIGWALLMMLAAPAGGGFAEPLQLMGIAGIVINVSLLALNLLPIPPLDGGRIVTGLLPQRAAYSFSRIEPYGFLILIALMATGLLDVLVRPLQQLALVVVGAVISIF